MGLGLKLRTVYGVVPLLVSTIILGRLTVLLHSTTVKSRR